jgi:PTS system cellobiose-specific IIC component
MQAVNIVIALAIYFPFFRMWDKMKQQEEGGVNNSSKVS